MAQGQLRARRNMEGSCPRLLLVSCVQRTPGRSLGAGVVVLPLLSDVSALLGDQLSQQDPDIAGCSPGVGGNQKVPSILTCKHSFLLPTRNVAIDIFTLKLSVLL